MDAFSDVGVIYKGGRKALTPYLLTDPKHTEEERQEEKRKASFKPHVKCKEEVVVIVVVTTNTTLIKAIHQLSNHPFTLIPSHIHSSRNNRSQNVSIFVSFFFQTIKAHYIFCK